MGVTIDPSPLARLATFTFYSDRDKWEKKQKDDALAAQRIANIAAFDVNSPFREYTDDLTKEVNELQNDIRKDPSIIIYDRNKPEKWIELQQRIGRIENKRKHATVNDVLYNAEKAKIELTTNKQERDDKLRLLDLNAKELFSTGIDDGYRKQFQASPQLKPEDYKIKPIPLTEAFTITRNANDTVIEGKAYADMDRVDAMADAVYFGFKQPLNENTPEFKAMSPEQQERARIEDRITSRSRVALDDIANNVNGLVQSFKVKYDTPDLKVKVEQIPDQELTQSGSIGGFIRLTKGYNKQVDEINAATGKKYPHINLDDGASPQEIIKLQSFSENGETLYKEFKPTVQQTDNALQGTQQAETRRHNIATENLDSGKLKLDQAKWNETMTGGETVKNGAMEFAKRLYEDMKKLTDKNGVISPDKIRQLNVEQLKYLGIEVPEERDAAGAIIQKGGFRPLQFEEGNQYAIQLINGEIRVLKPKEGETEIVQKPSGSYEGLFDPTKSTTLLNVATNRLNEQLRTAGAKELNSYMAIDLGTGGVTENTTGGSTSQSGSTVQKTDYYNVPDNVESQKGNRITYKDGTVWEIKGNKLNKIK